jgi:hypothetical protein
MIKVVHKGSMRTAGNDLEYWLSQPETARLEAIELLRQQFMSYQGNVQQRLQRVYRITRKTQR